jgi:hypothetical protein
MKIRNFKLLTLIGAVLVGMIPVQSAFGVSATLTGEITDDGGDPYLYVWFEYGKDTSYGNETTHQTKSGTGEFSAVVSNLEMCTTYHYRAVARHQNYYDIQYGEDKTFTTPCEVKINLKANNSDGPVTVGYKARTITLSWTSENADVCEAETISKPKNSAVSWAGKKATSGSESVSLDLAGSYLFRLICRDSASTRSQVDFVQVFVEQPALKVITKGVVITY